MTTEGTDRPVALVRGKPAWWARYMRFGWVQMGYSTVCMVLIPVVQWGLGNTAILWFFGAFLLGEFTWFVYLFCWLRGYGVSFVSPRKRLLPEGEVLCPNCLYTLCTKAAAPGRKECPECGCVVDGEEAMRAWERIRRMGLRG